MSEAWAELCPESNPAYEAVHEWASRKANKRTGQILGSRAALTRACSREQVLPFNKVSDEWTGLEDEGILEKNDQGFLVTEKFVRTFRFSRRSRGEGVILVAERLDDDDTTSRVTEAQPNRHPAVKQGSAQKKPRVDLCRHVFPDLVEDHGMETIRRDLYWKALYQNVQRLQLDYRVDLPFVRRMMEEFVRHPEWTQRSSRAAWQVFISRWQQLMKLVHLQRQRDPGARRHSGGAEYWLARP